MKRRVLSALFLVLTGLSAFAQTGVITQLRGEVGLKPAGAADFTLAKAGDQVAANTIVSTGLKSTAVITVGSAVIQVRPITRLSLSEIVSQASTEKVNVNLQAGRVRVDVNPPSGTRADFTLTSPMAVASVRGTSFDMDTYNLRVTTGTVAYRGINGVAVPVNAGASSMVNDTNGRAADPLAIQRQELLPPMPISGPTGWDGTANGPAAQPTSSSFEPGDGSYSVTLP
ncbi:iron dicitrate transporter FecR [Spirochaetia bacterium]|nr:iron dicitrate transporter FecR [Spirochaetia bacterium]